MQEEDFINIEWRGSTHPFFLDPKTTTLQLLKQDIELNFQIPIERQKIIGLRISTSRNSKEQEFDTLEHLGVKSGQTLKLLGQTREEIAQQGTEEQNPIVIEDEQPQVIQEEDDDFEFIDHPSASQTAPPAPTPPPTAFNPQQYLQPSSFSSSSSSATSTDYATKVHLKEILALHEPKSPTPFNMEKFFFEDTSFDTAFDVAKRDCKVLITVVYNSLDGKNLQYLTEVLTSDFIVELLKQSFVFWSCDVMNPEVYNQLQTLMRIVERSGGHFKSKFQNLEQQQLPITTLVSYHDGSISIIDMIEGVATAETIIQKLLSAIEIYGPLLENQKAGKAQKTTETQVHNNEVEERYRRAVEEDLKREKERQEQERQKQEAERLRLAEEARQKEEAERVTKLRESIAQSLPSEPAKGEKDTTTLRIRLQEGKQVERRFRTSETVGTVFNYLFADNQIPQLESAELVSNFPKKVFNFQEHASSTLKEVGLVGQGQLFVKEK